MKINIVFKNIEKSEIAQEIIRDRILHVTHKFPQFQKTRARVVVSMENSPTQSGADLFRIRLALKLQRGHELILNKSSKNLYHALAELCDSLLELLNNHEDKKRIKNRAKQRKFLRINYFNFDPQS